jgi:hypothetical protein
MTRAIPHGNRIQTPGINDPVTAQLVNLERVGWPAPWRARCRCEHCGGDCEASRMQFGTSVSCIGARSDARGVQTLEPQYRHLMAAALMVSAQYGQAFSSLGCCKAVCGASAPWAWTSSIRWKTGVSSDPHCRGSS